MSDVTTEACWFCDDDVRVDPPPGGWLLEDETWRAGAAPATYGVPGSVVLEARRHVADQADFDATERATVAETTGRLLRAVREVTGCDRVYQWATMDRYPHFHLWLVPWYSDAPTRGPRYLVESVVNVEPDEAATQEAVERLRGLPSARHDRTRLRTARAPARHRRRRGRRALRHGGRRGVLGVRPRGRRGRRGPADRAGAGRRGRHVQRGRLGPARDDLPDLGRHLRLRPRGARRVVGVPGGLGLRGRQDRVVRGDGGHVRGVRRAGRHLGAARSPRRSPCWR